MIDDTNIDDLIVRYYSGTLDETGAEVLAAWVLSDKANVRIFKSRIKELRSSDRTSSEAAGFITKINRKQHRKKSIRTLAISFAALGIAVLAVLMYGSGDSQVIGNRPMPAEQLRTAMTAASSTTSEAPGESGSEPISDTPGISETFVASTDKIMSLTLDDGTGIILNQGTRLTVDADFGQRTRTVHLDGEAFFDVAKNPSKPFCIICRDETYIVHGTSFNIQSYVRDGYSMVTLHTGSLEARVNGSKIMLSPGDELFVDESEGKLTRKKVNTAYSSMWTNDGRLHFSGLALKYVAAQLSHKYGVNVSVHSSVADIIYEGEIDKEPLETALKLISTSAPTSLKITNLDGEYYITKLLD